MAQLARRTNDDGDTDVSLLLVPAAHESNYIAHGSHSSHSSHRSHSSSSGGGGGGYGGYDTSPSPVTPAPPPPPRPAAVSFVAYPGGRISIDGQVVGRDATATLTLRPGSHTIRVENRFLGEEIRTVELTEGQTGVIEIDW